jgi:hypothetical protein
MKNEKKTLPHALCTAIIVGGLIVTGSLGGTNVFS